jgi:hypothetical protein
LTVTLPFTWTNKSKSGNYRYTVHPALSLLVAGNGLGLGYAAGANGAPPAVILSDEKTAGVYDTVYVDADFNQDLTREKRMRKGDEVSGADIVKADGTPGRDRFFDLSAGMLTWISDGTNPPPGVSAVYENVSVPESGALISFLGDENSHGTNCASDVAAQGRITDPHALSVSNPLYRGGRAIGGRGGAVLAGMAPKAKIAGFENAYAFRFDVWTLSTLGFDGQPGTGDESQISTNSFGFSTTIEDGWDPTARFTSFLNRTVAPNHVFLGSNGNSGHGYGTQSSPGSGTSIDVGASTSYGSSTDFDFVGPKQFTYGAVTPFSSRGPNADGDFSPDVTAVGAWGAGANPLNLVGNGQAAYGTFGGTSMASPIAAGVMAQIYEAFKENPANGGRYPTFAEAKALMLSGTRDLGYDVLTQGAGDVNADRSTDIAAGKGKGYMISPPQWLAGDYRGQRYGGFPSVMSPGASATQTFSVTNTSNRTYDVKVADVTLERAHELSFTVSLLQGSTPFTFTLPTYLREVTDLIKQYDPDLVQAQVIQTFDSFDVNGDYLGDNNFRAILYDWTDLNGDGNLWIDTNNNGVVETSEIDGTTGPNGESEYNRFAYGYPRGTYIEVSAGRDTLSRANDGVFFAIQRRRGTAPIDLQVRMSFFKKVDWNLVTTSATSMSVPAKGTGTFNATMQVPSDARPGVYQGAIEVSEGTNKSVIAVMTHVAANSTTFDFGAASLSEKPGTNPYANGHLFGGFDWSWRYDSGDWRLFFYDVPDGTAKPGQKMIVDTDWADDQTDVDTWVYGADKENVYSTDDPAFFGPSGVVQVGGSNNTNVATIDGNGTFVFDTTTGGSREVVGGDIRDGLGAILLHNVLNGGKQFAEPFTGSAYQVGIAPFPATISTTLSNGTIPFTFTTTRAISEGLGVLAFGLTEPVTATQETTNQDNPNDICTASFVREVNIAKGGQFIVTTDGADGLDIDLNIYKDGGNGAFDCGNAAGDDDVGIGGSAGATAEEQVAIILPEDGKYWVAVQGFTVPGGSQPFSLTIDLIQGSDLTVSNAPEGAVGVGAVDFNIDYTTTATAPKTLRGLLFVGPKAAPAALRVPITINLMTGVTTVGQVEAAAGGRTFLPMALGNR